MNRSNLLNILIALGAGWLVSEFVHAERPVQLGLGLFVCIAWLWISEALHISVTALLVPLLASLAGLVTVSNALVEFANPIIFLFMGGFALAAGLQKYELDRAFAVKVLALSRGHPLIAILLLFLVTACLSMWISNTATIAMMLPLAIGLLSSRNPEQEPALYLFVLLGLAYSGNIGGMATLIGSPPNAIAASAMGLSFSDWLSFGIPAFLLLFPLMILVLYLLIRPRFGQELSLDSHTSEPDARRGIMLVIFALTAGGWVLSSPLSALFGITSGFDSMIAIAAIVLLIGTGCLDFREFVAKTNWGILILFGGGLTLSVVLQSSGASVYLAEKIIALLPGNNAWLLLFIICLFVIFLTELVSNTASAALLVPLFVTAAAGFGYTGTDMAVMVALCASCAFMLPVATPPNALVFSSGFVPQRQMMKAGLILNIVCSLLLASYFLMITD
ncbi:MAG: DASS family sodium-coupled anion symporter [Pseudomonadales bacterium]